MALPNVSGRGFIIGEIRSGAASNGNVWVSFAAAFNKPEKDEDGNYIPNKDVKEKIVLQAKAWGKTAEFIVENFETQTEIDLTGQVFDEVRTGDDGTEYRNIVLKVYTAGYVEPRNGGGNQGGGAKKKPVKKQAASDGWD